MSFKVDVPVQHRMFWLAFADLERLMGYVPGFTPADAARAPDGVETVAGRLRLRIGSTSVTFEGTVRVLASDPTGTVLVLGVDGRQVRGVGTASGTVHIELHRVGTGTQVSVAPEIALTGRISALGGDRVATAAGRLVTAWLDGLAEQFHRPGPTPVAESRGQPNLHSTRAPTAEAVAEPVAAMAEPPAEPVTARAVPPPEAVEAVANDADLWPLGGPPQPRWLLIIGVAAGAGAATALLVALAIRRKLRIFTH